MEFIENHLLTLILFTPTVAALILLFIPGKNVKAFRWGALGAILDPLCPDAGCLGALQSRPEPGSAFPICGTSDLVRRHQRLLPPGDRRYFAAHGAADHAADAAGAAGFLQHQGTRQTLHDPVPAAGNRHVGRFHGARPDALLRVLGNWPGAHVLPDCPVGRRQPQLCLPEVRALHHGRFARSAAGDPVDGRIGRLV